jgi:hypothetical protein
MTRSRQEWEEKLVLGRILSFIYWFLFHFFFSLALQPPWALASAFSVSLSFLQTVGLLGPVISPSQCLYLNTGQHKHRINTYTHQISMAYVEFEPTIPASEWVKTVHALDRSAAVTGGRIFIPRKFLVHISLYRGWVDPRDIMGLEGLGQLKKTSDIGNWN